jgi:hypothetical protein
LVLTLAFFSPVLAGSTFSTVPGHQTNLYPWAALPRQAGVSDTYPQTDQADLNHPWQSFISTSVRAGDFPFWDPHSFGGGYPLFANGQSAVLYPPRLLTALTVSPSLAHDLFSMLHVFLSGLAMFAFMKELRAGMAGALLAAVAWMFASFNLAWLHLEVVTPMSLFLPLTLLLVHRSFRLGSWPWTVFAGLGLGLTLLSGHLILLGLVYMVALAYAAALCAGRVVAALRAREWRRCVPDVARSAVMVAVSLGAAAVLLVPTAFVIADSHRDPFTYQELVGGAVPAPEGGVPFLAPARTFLYSFFPPPRPVTSTRMHEMAFAGTATACLALVGLFLRRPGTWLGRALLVVSFAVAVGGPATWLAYHLLPGFDVFRPYSRLLIFWSFGVALLGGWGLDAVWSWAHPGHQPARRAPPALRATVRGRQLVVGAALVAVAVTALQLVFYGREINPPFVRRTSASLFPRTPLIGQAVAATRDQDLWPGRVMPLIVVDSQGRSALPTLFAADSLLYGLDSTGGYDSVVARRTVALTRVLGGETPEAVLGAGLPAAYSPLFLSSTARLDLLARLGVTHIVATPRSTPSENWGNQAPGLQLNTLYDGVDGRLLEVQGAPRGPLVVSADEVVDNAGDALRRLVATDFDPRRSVILEKSSRPRRLSAGAATGDGRVLASHRGVNDAGVSVDSSGPAWLVVPQSWSPGWSATVNGEPAKVVRANYAKQAIQVPAGRSEVELNYRPVGFSAGLVVTVMTLLGCAVALALQQPQLRYALRRRSRRGRESAGSRQ